MYDDSGSIRTFDLYRLFAGWDGGTIHDAFRDFKTRPSHEKDAFCNMAMNHLDNHQIRDLENGFLAQFFAIRLKG